MVTIGVKLFYKEGTSSTVPSTGMTSTVAQAITDQIYGVQNIPELQTAPTAIDVTSLEDTEEQSEPGLISGSSLSLTMNYKEGVYTEGTEDRSNFEQCLDLSDDNVHSWKIVLPNGRWFAFYGKARTTLAAMAVASAQQFTLSLFKRSKVLTGYDASLRAESTYSATNNAETA